MSQYIVSARKYRPDSFGTLIGQDNIAQTLKNSILRGQLAHAYLFCGPRGVGKTTTARIFAKMINCSDPTENMEPCGKCESCLSFAEGRSYCIHELDAASNNGVDDIKALMDQVRIPPQVGRYSVYIIDEVHMLSQSAFNAFLKTLEEPPAHAIFILATTEKHKILPTILSRCQTYDFNRITVENIVRNLRMVASGEGVTIDDESLHVIAHKADGAMRDALTIFDQTVAFCGTDVKYEDVLRNLNVLDYEYSFSLVDAFLAGDWSSALMTFDGILAKGFNALHFVAALSSHLRDLLVSKSGGLEALLELPESLKKKYMEQASRCPLQFLYEALGITAQCESGYRASVNPRLHIEFSLMRLSFLMNRQAGVQAAAQPVAVQSVAAQPAAVQQTSVQQAVSKPALAQQPAVQPSMVQPGQAQQTASQQTVVQQTTVRQVSEQGAPAQPSAVQPANSPAPVEKQPEVPVASEVLHQGQHAAAAPSVPEGQVPARDRRARSARPAASLSLKSMMEAAPEVAAAAAEDTPLPEDELLIEKWPELARQYEDKPRLASMLTTTTLTIEPSDSAKTVIFRVVNEAQKEWVESKLLHDLEGSYRKIVGSMKVYLRVSVTQDTVEHKKIYMPSEKAKELMSENDEVKNLVKDFGLDIK